jgi:hypothetical protein
MADRRLAVREQPGIVRAAVGEHVAHLGHARGLVA